MTLLRAKFRLPKQRGQSYSRIRLALFVFALSSAIITPIHKSHAAAGEHGIGLSLGQILLMGDFAKNFSDSLGFNLTYSYEASAVFGLLADISMSSHTNGTATNELSLKGFSPNLRINLAFIDKLIVYSFVGFGLFMASEKVGNQNGAVTTLGFDMGGAFNLALDKHFQFGTALSFHNIFGKTDDSTATATQPGLSVGGTYLALMLQVFYIF